MEKVKKKKKRKNTKQTIRATEYSSKSLFPACNSASLSFFCPSASGIKRNYAPFNRFYFFYIVPSPVKMARDFHTDSLFWISRESVNRISSCPLWVLNRCIGIRTVRELPLSGYTNPIRMFWPNILLLSAASLIVTWNKLVVSLSQFNNEIDICQFVKKNSVKIWGDACRRGIVELERMCGFCFERARNFFSGDTWLFCSIRLFFWIIIFFFF